MNKCPECNRYSLDYFSAAKMAKCLFCGYSEMVTTRDEFFSQFPNGRSVTMPSNNPEQLSHSDKASCN